MNKRPLVSVIIPNYNHARYLDQRLQTVLNQTYQNFEVIILDDKSTDNSLEVIEKYKDNPHISQIVVNDVNSGSPFKQWDKGIHLAMGELVWIAESDDYCELNFLDELVVAFVNCQHCVIAYSTHVIVSDEGEEHRNKLRVTREFNGKKYVIKQMSLSNQICNASTAIFRKEAWTNIPNDFQSFQGAGDYLFWTQIACQGNVALVFKNLSYYRRHSSTVTNNNIATGTASEEDYRVLKYIDDCFKLSFFRKNLSYYCHGLLFQSGEYYSDEIKERVMDRWKIGRLKCPIIYSFYFNLQSRMKRRWGILI